MGNGPKPGQIIKVEPIRSLPAIKRIKKLLEDKPRDNCLFVLGINTALRGGELLSLTVGDVQHLKAGDVLEVPERKTGKKRVLTINENAATSINQYLRVRGAESPGEALFIGQRGRLTVQYLNRLVKKWCSDAGLTQDNYGSHTLRKTWGYHQRVTFKTDLVLIMRAFGHSSQAITLQYLGIQPEEIEKLYLNSI